MSPVRSFLPAWADGLKRGCGGQQGWRSQDRAALDWGLGVWIPEKQGGSSPPVAPAAGRPGRPASAASPEGEAAKAEDATSSGCRPAGPSARAWASNPANASPPDLRGAGGSGPTEQRRNSERGAGRAGPRPELLAADLEGPGDPAAGGAARRPWGRQAAAPSPEKAAGAGGRGARRPASRGTPGTVPGPRLPPQLSLCSHHAPREGPAARAGTPGTPASDLGSRRRPRSNAPRRAPIGQRSRDAAARPGVGEAPPPGRCRLTRSRGDCAFARPRPFPAGRSLWSGAFWPPAVGFRGGATMTP